MSYDFGSHRNLVGRKDYVCEQCRKTIAVGSRHSYWAGKHDGNFWAYREHMDCRDAWLGLIDFRKEDSYEGIPFLCDDDVEPEDRAWVGEKWPAVADRLGWKP